jgi:spore coat polysaccharide biosynthesis protein SpsF
MSAERVVAIVEARMGSTRLPGKSLKPIAGRPLVARVIERIRRARTLDELVLATSTNAGDDVLAALAGELGIRVHRGSELDVLERILGAAQMAGATIHVQCWGDCPFVEPTEIDRVVGRLRESSADLVGNGYVQDRLLPYGLDVIALRVAALERSERETRDQPYHREHGTTYLYQNPSLFRVECLETPSDLAYPKLDVTINKQSDYEFVSRIYDLLYPHRPDFSIRDVLALIRSTPDLLAHPNGAALREAAT